MNFRPLMKLTVAVAEVQKLGPTPHGTRTIAAIRGGTFDGERLRGAVLDGGDWIVVRSDGVLELDLRIALRTDDGALIQMSSFGLRHGPPDVLDAMARGEVVDPARYYFRTTPRFETAAPRYLFLNKMLAVASGDRQPGGPIYTIDEVL